MNGRSSTRRLPTRALPTISPRPAANSGRPCWSSGWSRSSRRAEPMRQRLPWRLRRQCRKLLRPHHPLPRRPSLPLRREITACPGPASGTCAICHVGSAPRHRRRAAFGAGRTPAPRQVRVALVIGNSAYRSATPLTNPANDAADLANVLRDLGFEVIEGGDLDKRGIDDTVREFGRKLDRRRRSRCLLRRPRPAGRPARTISCRSTPSSSAPATSLRGDRASTKSSRQMEAAQRVNLVFLDACRDNPLARTLARSLGMRSATVGAWPGSHPERGRHHVRLRDPARQRRARRRRPQQPVHRGAAQAHRARTAWKSAPLMKRVRADVIAGNARKAGTVGSFRR